MPDNEKYSFRHLSLQDRKSVQAILKAITKGIAKGTLEFSDEDGAVTLHPEGLLNLKVTARKEGTQDRLDIQVSWHSADQTPEDKKLSVGSGDNK